MRNPITPSSSGSKTTTPCCSKVGIKKGPWTPEEDEILSNYIHREGEGRWRTLPKRAGLLRCGKSCRLRWMNYLRPSVKRGRIAPDEEDLILRLHRLLGNRWSLIAGRIPGRTDNEIKNYWNTHLSKKLISQGIDPRTHKPLNPPPPPPTATSSETGYDHKQVVVLSNPNPNPNPDHASFELEKEPGGSYNQVITTNTGNFTNGLKNHCQNDVQVVDNGDGGGFMMGLLAGDNSTNRGRGNQEENNYYIGNCIHEDTFSSFLDSLINDNNMFVNNHHLLQPQQPLPPVLPPEHGGVVATSGQTNFSHGAIWEAEMVSTMAAALGDAQNAMDPRHA